MDQIKAEWFLFHIMYVTQLFFLGHATHFVKVRHIYKTESLSSCIRKVFRVGNMVYNFPCLHSTTQSNFWGNIEDGHMGTIYKKLVENFT